jgi:hypothetical protein
MQPLKHSNSYYRDLKRFPSRQGRSFHHFSYRHLKHRRSYYWMCPSSIDYWEGALEQGLRDLGNFQMLPSGDAIGCVELFLYFSRRP